MARYMAMAVDSAVRACSALAGLVAYSRTEPPVAVGLERAHAELLGQGQGLLVVGFGLRGIGRIGVGMDDAKLVQRERLVAHVPSAAGPGRAPGGRAARPPRRVPPDDRPR